MAFLRLRSFYRDSSILRRAFSFGLFRLYQKAFHDTLPKFPFPSAENATRHQVVQPRPAPIKIDTRVSKQLNKPSLAAPTSRSVISFPRENPLKIMEPLPASPLKRQGIQLSKEKSVRTMMKQLKFQKQLEQIQKDFLMNQAGKSITDKYIKKLSKLEDSNKQAIDTRIREERREERKSNLREVQQDAEQFNSYRKETQLHYASHWDHNDYLSPTQATNYSCFVPRYKHEVPDFGTYTPANPDSDNCDIPVKSELQKLESSPGATCLHPPRLDEQMTRQSPEPYSKESAMCLLCRDALTTKAKY